MNPENTEKLSVEYQAGKAAFERGDYRKAVQHLETACALVTPNSRKGGEVHTWLVTAYEATGQRTEAIALCKQLERHPDLETRKQSKRLRYILEAPPLARREDWLTKIPDLTTLPDADDKFSHGSTTLKGKGNPAPKPKKAPEPIDLSQVNTKDNKFIWVALIAAGLALGGLVWLSV